MDKPWFVTVRRGFGMSITPVRWQGWALTVIVSITPLIAALLLERNLADVRVLVAYLVVTFASVIAFLKFAYDHSEVIQLDDLLRDRLRGKDRHRR